MNQNFQHENLKFTNLKFIKEHLRSREKRWHYEHRKRAVQHLATFEVSESLVAEDALTQNADESPLICTLKNGNLLPAKHIQLLNVRHAYAPTYAAKGINGSSR